MQNRLKSKVVWLSVIAQIVLLISLFNPQMADEFKAILTALVEIATVIGFLNNPTDSTKF